MALRLSTLPNDILLEILDPLLRKDLYNVALVSRQLNGPAHRLLLRSVDLRILFPRGPWDPTEDTSLAIFARLIDTLTKKPHLQPYVTELSVKVFPNTRYPRFRDHANILGLLPNLQSLWLQPPPYDFRLSVLASSNLQTLFLDFSQGRDHNGNAEVPVPLDIIEEVFWAPRLRTLLVEGVVFDSKFNRKFEAHPSRSSSITDLQFRECDQEQLGCLPSMLSCIKALETFVFDIHTSWETSEAYAKGIEPSTLCQVLGMHAESLVHLEIASSDAAEFPHTSLFGCLKGYHKLKKLAIPDELLFNVRDKNARLVDVLPAGLEELQLQYAMLRTQGTDFNWSLRLDRIRELAHFKDKYKTALRRVAVWCQPCECWSNDGSLYGPLSDMDNLKAVLELSGIEFQFLSEPYFDRTPFGGDESHKLFGRWIHDSDEYI